MRHIDSGSYLKRVKALIREKNKCVPQKISGETYDRRKDQEYSRMLKSLTQNFTRTYPLHTITNEPREQNKFFRAFYQNKIYNPDFHYQRKTELSHEKSFLLIKKLNQFAEKLKSEQGLGQIYLRRIFDAQKAIVLNTLSQKKGFSWASRQYYNFHQPTQPQLSSTFNFPLNKRESIEAYEVTYLAQKIIFRLGLKHRAHVSPRESRFRGMATTKSKIGIGAGTLRSPAHIIRSLAHEILGHALASMNARKYPAFFARHNSAPTLKKEEGLAVKLGELAYQKLKHLLPPQARSQKENYLPLLRMKAILAARRKSFYETFKYLTNRLKINDCLGWELTVRAKRGVAHTNLPGANYHDILYFGGLQEIDNLIQKKKCDFQETIALLGVLGQGKFDLTEFQFLKKHFPSFQHLNLNHFFALFQKELGKIIKNKFTLR